MEPYLPISFLNDFIFCPRSIYFHQLYGRVSQKVYHTTDQTRGLAAHRTVDTEKYSSSSSVLQGAEVYSDRYNLAGKIDTFNQANGLLIERKKKIRTIYDGYIFQLYAQYYCLVDMGYRVAKIGLYSMDDNKRYPVPLPESDLERKAEFERVLQDIRAYQLETNFSQNPKKCERCIYQPLCDIPRP